MGKRSTVAHVRFDLTFHQGEPFAWVVMVEDIEGLVLERGNGEVGPFSTWLELSNLITRAIRRVAPELC